MRRGISRPDRASDGLITGCLIIGVGNPLRGDDGAGPRVAETLRRRGYPAIAVHQLTPELAEVIAQAPLAIFIDADVRLEPGEVRTEPIFADDARVLEHHASPAALLRLASEAYGRAPEARLIGIGPRSFECGRRLSAEVRRAVAKVAGEFPAKRSEVVS